MPSWVPSASRQPVSVAPPLNASCQSLALSNFPPSFTQQASAEHQLLWAPSLPPSAVSPRATLCRLLGGGLCTRHLAPWQVGVRVVLMLSSHPQAP